MFRWRYLAPCALVAGAAALSLVFMSCGSGGSSSDAENRVQSNAQLDWRDQVIYQLLTDRFADGDVNNNWNVDRGALAKYQGGDFQGIIDNLGYIRDLGATAIWISPVVKNVEDDAGVHGYHGYWTQDFTRTNPHFGTLTDLRRMVNACHDAGVLVICDVVTNHIGQLFFYDMNQNGVPDATIYGSNTQHTHLDPFYYMLEYDPPWDPIGIQTAVGSPYNEQGMCPIRWLRDPYSNHMPIEPAEFQNPSWYHRRGRVVPESNGNWPFVGVQLGDFPGGSKDLATEREDVRDALVRVFADWIRRVDFDGFRIDTLKHVERAEDVVNWQQYNDTLSGHGVINLYQYQDGYRHPAAAQGRTYPDGYPGFWEVFCPAMRQAARDKGKHNFFMFGESYDGSAPLCGSYTQLGENDYRMLDSVFNFPAKYAVMNGVIANGDPTTNIEAAFNDQETYYGNTPQLPAAQLNPIVLPSQTVQADDLGLLPTDVLVNFIDNHDVERFINTAYGDERKVRLALAVVYAEKGIPCIYYGTEQMFTGVGPGGQQAIAFSGRGDPTNREVLWDTGFDRSTTMFQWIKRLGEVRRAHVALRRGSQHVLWATTHTGSESDAGIFAFERRYAAASDPHWDWPGGVSDPAATETALFVMNVHPTQTSQTSYGTASMQTTLGGATLVDRLDPSFAPVVVPAGGSLTVSVPPLTARILVRQ